MPRPSSTEHIPYFGRYIDLVPEDDILAALEAQLGETLRVMRGVSEEVGNQRHPPYTWSVKEVIGHLADAEVILWISRFALRPRRRHAAARIR
jgi:hypothetical protein